MWSRVLAVLFCFIGHTILAQIEVAGVVLDARTQAPIDGVHVVVKGTSIHTFSAPDGTFSLQVPNEEAHLVFARIGYEVQEIRTDKELRILLLPEIQQLGTAEVTSENNREEVSTGSPTMAVLDYAFMDRFILILGRDHVGNRTVLRLLSETDEVITERVLTEAADRLITDCTGTVHLLTEKQAYQLYYDYEQLHLLYPVSPEVFASIVSPCLEHAFGHVYVRRDAYLGLRSEIWAAGPDSTFCMVKHEDHENVTYLHREYDLNYYLAIRRNGGGYMYPVDVLLDNLEFFHENQTYGFLESKQLAPAQIDVVQLGDYVTVWNWPLESVQLFQEGHRRVDAIPSPISSAQLIPGTDRFALYFSRQGSGGNTEVFRVNTQFESDGKWTLDQSPFAEKLRLRGNTVFFLDKTPGRTRGFRLYRRRLQ